MYSKQHLCQVSSDHNANALKFAASSEAMPCKRFLPNLSAHLVSILGIGALAPCKKPMGLVRTTHQQARTAYEQLTEGNSRPQRESVAYLRSL